MLTEPRLLRCGWHAVLAEFEGLEQVLAFAEAVQSAVATGEHGFTEVIDVVPAAATGLVIVGDGRDITSLRPALAQLAATASAAPGRRSGDGDAETVEIGVHYNGPDLDDVAAMTGLARHEVIEAHTATSWQVAFGGFAPGFVYLTGGDSRLRVPRRREPRTTVPAGSVGLAGDYSAVSPRSSPGGWQLLGHTDAVIWDLERDPPALLRPGTTVRFVELVP
jgi:KipI family sensor histidine kinase inhibitor